MPHNDAHDNEPITGPSSTTTGHVHYSDAFGLMANCRCDQPPTRPATHAEIVFAARSVA